MKRLGKLLAPPFAFALAAGLAWVTGSPVADTPDDTPEPVGRAPRHREFTGMGSVDRSATLAELEHEILHHPAPPMEIHDAETMEAVLDMDERSRCFPGGGMGAIEFSMDWAEEAPEQMFAWLLKQSGSNSHRGLFPAYMLFGQWAENNMEAALAAALTIPDRRIRRQALFSTLQELCKTEPQRARDLLMQNLDLFPPDEETPVIESYEAPDTTCDMLLSLPPGAARTHLLADLLASMADSYDDGHTAQARTIWQQAPDTLRIELVAAGFRSGVNASSFDGLEDLMREHAESSGDPAIANRFIEAIGPAWAKRDLASALDWAQAHLKGKSGMETRSKLFRWAASDDFDTALRVLGDLPDGSLKLNAAEALVRGAPDDRKPEAEAMLRSLSE